MIANSQAEKWISLNMYNDWLNEMPPEKAFFRMCLMLRVLRENWSYFSVFEDYKGENKSEYVWPHFDSNTWSLIEKDMEQEFTTRLQKQLRRKVSNLPKESILGLILTQNRDTANEIIGKPIKRKVGKNPHVEAEISRCKRLHMAEEKDETERVFWVNSHKRLLEEEAESERALKKQRK